jgi:Cof subfamily protein (haloacid dehalogenase superfamily)
LTAEHYALVATDLDGTLFRRDLTVSPRTVKALDLVTDAGAAHVIVTGRPPADCRAVFEALDYRGLAVCGQGALLFDAGAGRVVARTPLPRPTARRVVAALDRRIGGISLAVHTTGPDARLLATPAFAAAQAGFADCAQVLAERLWDDELEKVFVRRPGLTDDRLAALLREESGEALEVTHSGQGMVELLPHGITKATGLAQVADLLGIPAHRTVAFGDMPNDLPVFAWAGRAVAMANSHPDVLAAADETAPSNEDDGVAVVLERMVEQGLLGAGEELACTS